jgi:hypothetical protein
MRTLHENDVARSRMLVRDMTTLTENRGYDFNPAWLEKQNWVVVPVEDSGHFAEEEIARIVPAVVSTGYPECLAVGALDLPNPMPTCFEFSISTDELRAFNTECGIFRFLLTCPKLSWAISCNEWFNLFAGPPALVEQMVGAPIGQAREEFLDYARMVEQGSEGPLVVLARQYGATG